MNLPLDIENRIDALLEDIGRCSEAVRRQRVKDLVHYVMTGKDKPQAHRK